MICGLADSLLMMILGRVGQGLSGGILIPTAMTIIATRLPPTQQPIGTAAFGALAIMGPVAGPLLGGWLTENLSWHYAFFINMPIGVMLIGMLLVGLPHEKPHLKELTNADWFGVAGLILGLGGFTVVLEDGHREGWFDSAEIRLMTGIAIVGAVWVTIGQFTARRPVIKMSLLANRAFGAVFLTGMAIGAVLYGVAYVIPQFLSAVSGYNALQAGQIVAVSGIPSLVMMAFVPLLIRTIDVRVAVSAGLIILAVSCLIDTSLTTNAAGGDLVGSQLLRGAGQILAMVFLNQAGISAVPPQDAADAAGLFSAGRNLGGSIGLALLATLQDERLWFHERMIESSVSANAAATQDYVASHAGSQAAASLQLTQIISKQALVMTYNGVFFVVGVAILAVLPLVFLLRPLRRGQSVAMH